MLAVLAATLLLFYLWRGTDGLYLWVITLVVGIGINAPLQAYKARDTRRAAVLEEQRQEKARAAADIRDD
ncbi:hypothetical protein IWX64_002644 [Arthrobacter sp. CAN_A212]